MLPVAADWGPCVFDTRHNFNMSLVANSGLKSANPWIHRLLSDWQLAPLLHASSGQPVNLITGQDNSLTSINQSNNDRPNQVLADVSATNPICNTGATPGVQWFNKDAFLPNATGAFGNLGRNAVRGPHTVNVDFALSRIFKINDRHSIQARADVFNVLNHANFVGAISPAGGTAYPTFSNGVNPNNLSTSSFGRIQSAFDPRIVQFALKTFF
jgi:hypothetical protein